MAEEEPQKPAEATIPDPPGQELPTLFANRFHVVMAPDLTRIVFGENVQPSAKTHHKMAVMLRTADVKELSQMLQALFAQIEQQQKASEQPPQKDA